MGSVCANDKGAGSGDITVAEGDQKIGLHKLVGLPEPNNESRIERSPKYIGSFGKLKRFLRKCLDSDVLDETQFNDLLAALEDLGEHGKEKERLRHITVMTQPLFRGVSEQDVADGMGLMDMTAPKPTLTKKLSLNEGTFVVEDKEKEGVNEFAALLKDVSFNCRTRGTNFRADVQAVTYGFTAPYNLVGRYKIDNARLEHWVSEIANLYNANPYHNWMHAIDVFQFLHCCLAVGGAGEYFNFQDILAILFGAIAHDVGHTGVNNAFLINSSAKLAITYNDISPLENMHASVAFEVLNANGNNFLDCLKPEDFKIFRSKVIDNILATDMSHHFDIVDKFSARVEHQTDTPFVKNTKDDRERQAETKEDRRLLMQAFTHMGDLSHCTRPWNVHKLLVTCLEEEFFSQGDKEKEVGLPISPMNDRTKDSAPAGQTFFLDKLVRPLLEPYCSFVAPALGETFKGALTVNREKWVELVRVHGKLAAKDLIPLEGTSSQTSG